MLIKTHKRFKPHYWTALEISQLYIDQGGPGTEYKTFRGCKVYSKYCNPDSQQYIKSKGLVLYLSVFNQFHIVKSIRNIFGNKARC